MSKMLRAALAYQKLGFEVVPLHTIKGGICTCKLGKECPSPGKHPRTLNGLSDASRDITIINGWFKKWPDSNLALTTGTSNGFIVIDVDINQDIGKYGDESLETLEKELGKLPDTVEQITGSGGRHILFKAPQYPINNRTGIEPWIDVKGEKGYIVVSPSKHISGRNYEWEVSSRIGEVELATLPDSWLQFITGEKSKEKKEPLTIGEVFPEGTRNNNMFKIACSLHAKGYGRGEIKALMMETNKTRCSPMMEEHEIETIISSTVDRYPAGCSFEKKEDSNDNQLVFDEEYCIYMKSTDTWRPKNIQENVEKLLTHYNIIPKYNELTKSLDVEIPGRNFTQDNSEELTLQYIYNLCLKNGFVNISKELIKAMVLDVGDRDKYNPVKKYLDSIYSKNKEIVSANGTKEFNKLIETLETKSFNPFIKEMLIKKWLISCVEAVYSERGIASQGILTLQGEQGDGKTTWFKNLFKMNPDWFGEGLTLDPSNKDSVSRAVSYWVCELGEIEATLKKDLDILKSYITNTCDVLRRPYARGTSYFPRRTIFCGSVNGSEFLKDDTGNRRFWAIPVTRIHNNNEVNLDLLWSEICYMREKGENWWLDSDEVKALNESNKMFEAKNYIDTLMEATFSWSSNDRYWLRASDIFLLLGSGKELSSTKIGIALKKRNIDFKSLDGYKWYKMPKAHDFCAWNFEKVM
jgi:hypothetical protein